MANQNSRQPAKKQGKLFASLKDAHNSAPKPLPLPAAHYQAQKGGK